MDSIPESPGLSATRRLQTVRTYAHQRSDHGALSESPPRAQNRATRTPALDLAQQAQLAACNYLGYNPRDLPNPIYQQQGVSSDTSRPLELHMHHFYHHYLGAPAGKFSQSESQLKGSFSNGTSTSTAANHLAITAGSTVPRKTRAIPAPSSNFATGFETSSAGSARMAFPREQSSSLPMLHGGASDFGKKQGPFSQNLLRLRNQSGDDAEHLSKQSQSQDERLGLKALSGRDGAAVDVGHPGCVFQSRITTDCVLAFGRDGRPGLPKPIQGARPLSCLSLSWSHDEDGKKDSLSDLDNPCNVPSNLRKPNSSAVKSTICEATKTLPNCRRSIGLMPSEISVSGDSNSSDAQVNASYNYKQREGMPLPSAKRINGSFTKSVSQNANDLGSSSLDNDSASSSGKRSGRTSTLSCSTCTKVKNHEKETPAISSARRTKARFRRARKHGSRRARPWDMALTNSSEMPTDSNTANLEMEDRICEPAEKSIKSVPDKAIGERLCSESGKPRYERGKEESKDGAERKTEKQRASVRHYRTPRTQTSNLVFAESPGSSWTTSLKPNGGSSIQQVYKEPDRIRRNMLKLENLHDDKISGLRSANRSSSNNRLREAVEAAWKTNLGSKSDVDTQDIKRNLDNYCWVVHKYHDSSKYHVVKDDSRHRYFKSKSSVSPTVEEKVRGYEEAWKANLGAKQSREDNHQNDWADPVFETIHREQEDLKALIAREATLQRQLKDQTEARVAAEAKARALAEHKAQLCAASAKAAEDGLRVLLDERAQFHSKVHEELQQGATDRSRLQDLLQLEKLKLEATEGELQEVRKSFQDALAGGSLALPSKTVREDQKLDAVAMHALEQQANGTEQNKSRQQLMAESEGRVTAEARASFFEASAKAAEERLRDVLDERTWYYTKFKEELENGKTDLIKLRQLVEQEKASAERSNAAPEMKVDTQKLVASSVTNNGLDVRDQDAQSSTPNSAVEIKGSLCSTVEQETEREQTAVDAKDLQRQSGEGGSETKASTWSSCAGSRKKNEKKRPFSPQKSSRDFSDTQLDGNFSLKFDKNGIFGGEAIATVDISPSMYDKCNPSTRQVMDHSCFPKQLPVDCTFTANGAVDIKENSTMITRSPRPAQDGCVEVSENAANQIAALPSKWKRETKAELRRIMQQQEVICKIAEDAVDELGRRLELLERYKMDIQDTLEQSKVAAGNMDCFCTRLEEKLEDFPRGFNSFYNSPIFEGRRKSLCSPPTDKDTQTRVDRSGQALPCWCITSTLPNESKDDQIHKLKAEIDQLKDELQRRERKSSFQSMGRHSPGVPNSPPTQSASEWSSPSRRDAAMITTQEDHFQLNRVPQANHKVLKLTALEMESALPDDPFEEMKVVTMQSIQNDEKGFAGSEFSTEVCFQHAARDIDDRSWAPTSDAAVSEKMLASISGRWADHDGQQMFCCQQHCGDRSLQTSGNRSSNEGDLQVYEAMLQRISDIFREQESKVEKLRDAEPKYADSSKTLDLRKVYLEVLKSMSTKFEELFRDLQATEQPHEKLVQRCRCMDMMDESARVVESGDRGIAILEMKDSDVMNVNSHFQSRDERSFKNASVHKNDAIIETKSLRAALTFTEKKLADEVNASHILTKELESGAQQLARVMEEHAAEMHRKDQSLSYAHKLNEQLATDLSHVEKSLSELGSRYNNLVSNLEHQLETARSEVGMLQETVNELKVEILRKESVVETLQVAKHEQEVQLRDLQSQLNGIQSEKSAILEEKLDRKKQLAVQNKHVNDLISINNELVSYSQTKEDEIKALDEVINNLKHSVSEKSDEVKRLSEEAQRLSGEARNLSHDVVEARGEAETYRLRCADLKIRLDQTEHELYAREESIDRLTGHLQNTIEGQDVILVEKEQLLQSLNRAQYKEHRMDDQVRQSKIIIQELEEKINFMDADINQARLQLSEMKARGQEAQAMEQQAEEMRSRVHQLEEEVMEKDGQITILKTSLPRKFDHRLDYDSAFEPLGCSSAY